MRISPLKGLYYNIRKVRDFNRVCCPPYDLIKPGEIKYYRANSDYNMVNLILRKPANYRQYLKARDILSSWMRSRILLGDDKPCFYLYNIRYKDNRSRSLKGFLGLLNISSVKGIYDHERVYPRPRNDRFSLLKAVRTNLSPIYLLSFSKKKIVSNLYEKFFDKSESLVWGKDNSSCRHFVRRLELNGIIKRGFLGIENEAFLIADGHHRFSASIRFRDYLTKKYGRLPRNHPANFVFCFFSDIYQEGLKLDTFYRILKKRVSKEKIKKELAPFFFIEEIKNPDIIRDLSNSSRGVPIIGFTQRNNSYILRLKSLRLIERFYPPRLKPLLNIGVFVLHDFILHRLLRLGIREQHLEYTHSWDYFKSQASQFIGFVPGVVSKDGIEDIAKRKLLFPHKSTYFFPKLLSGLIIRKPF